MIEAHSNTATHLTKNSNNESNRKKSNVLQILPHLSVYTEKYSLLLQNYLIQLLHFYQRSICRGAGRFDPPLVEDDPHTGN